MKPAEKKRRAELIRKLAQAEREYLVESSRFVQIGPLAPADAQARLFTARTNVEAIRLEFVAFTKRIEGSSGKTGG